MIQWGSIVEAMVETLDALPDLREALGLAEGATGGVVGYYDSSKANSLTHAQYSQKAGVVMVAWDSTTIDQQEGGLGYWSHTIVASFRPALTQDPAAVIKALVDGVPDGETLPWRYCPVIEGTLPPEVLLIERSPDEEQLDVFQVKCTIRETGD